MEEDDDDDDELLCHNAHNKQCNRLCYFYVLLQCKDGLFWKGMEPTDVDKGRVAQYISKPEIALNLLLLGSQIEKS